jgi:hypothetical protein
MTSPAALPTSSNAPQATLLLPITKANNISTSCCTDYPTSAAKNRTTSGLSWPRWRVSSALR